MTSNSNREMHSRGFFFLLHKVRVGVYCALGRLNYLSAFPVIFSCYSRFIPGSVCQFVIGNKMLRANESEMNCFFCAVVKKSLFQTILSIYCFEVPWISFKCLGNRNDNFFYLVSFRKERRIKFKRTYITLNVLRIYLLFFNDYCFVSRSQMRSLTHKGRDVENGEIKVAGELHAEIKQVLSLFVDIGVTY